MHYKNKIKLLQHCCSLQLHVSVSSAVLHVDFI